jgi:TIR domain/NB-ARC domain
MDPPQKAIFISYSRSDGRAFAEAFEDRLKGEGIHSWRDIKDMSSGEILPQVLHAIEDAKHLVLILSRRALASDWIKREWSHARMVGKKVSPVLADPTIKRSDLPPWIRREEIFEIAEPERWTQLVRILQGPGETRRAPYMPGDLREGFVPRPVEYNKLKSAVLTARTDKTVAVTTALYGAGGYGKTTLANYLCRDPDVRFEFTDGILRVEIGKERDDVTGLVLDLITKLDPKRQRPGFQDLTTAAEDLAEIIGEGRILLVIDDVWREVQLRPFLRGGPNCVRLVTTRLPGSCHKGISRSSSTKCARTRRQTWLPWTCRLMRIRQRAGALEDCRTGSATGRRCLASPMGGFASVSPPVNGSPMPSVGSSAASRREG